jgi:hypothetical protein
MHVSKRMMQMTRLEPLTIFDASLALVIGKRFIPVHSLKILKW